MPIEQRRAALIEAGKSWPHRAQNLLLRLRQANGVDRIVGAAAGEIFDRLHRIACLRVDTMGRAHAARECELVVDSYRRR